MISPAVYSYDQMVKDAPEDPENQISNIGVAASELAKDQSLTASFDALRVDATDQDVIVVTARPHHVSGDPLQSLNVTSFKAVQTVDKAFVGPVAMAYKNILPDPVRSGVRNLLSNLQEPGIFLNFLLQLKLGKAAETLGRFAINSTVGAAGLIDVAKTRPFNLPHRPNGFGYTLGYYGVKTGPYLYLPLIGPTTLRDLFGRSLDLLVLPISVGRPFTHPAYAITSTTLKGLDDRVLANDELDRILHKTADPYAALRDAYLQKRQAEIDELHVISIGCEDCSAANPEIDDPSLLPVK